ncbi:MAG: competence/damage-inducible protein A [Clostridium sp.]|nr:competence/damage-inducible protein A [Clostridium sp.]
MSGCELLCVGTELLLGDIVNTNAAFLARELAARGIPLHRQSVVGDNPERLRDAFLQSLSRAELVIVTGGLGPTPDDITRETVCAALGLELKQDDALAEAIRDFFLARACPMPKGNLRQAMVPKGARVFANKNGTAPGLGIRHGGKGVILLPGPPRELEPMFLNSVQDFLEEWSEGVILSRMVRTMGIGESAMSAAVEDLLDGENPSVAPYAKSGEALLRVTARAPDEKAAAELLAPVLEEIQRRLGDRIYGIDVPSIESVLVKELGTAGKSLATAESITGGGLAKRLTDCPGASSVLKGAAVAYCNEAKENLLGVARRTLKEQGAVSAQCAEEMASGALRLFGTDFALATTGFADANDELHAYVALAARGRETQTEHIRFARNDRAANRLLTENAAFMLLLRAIRK